ncbi:PilX N-terminal domain-containing pilus assembly protein [Aeromonas media]|uniref:PilX N-terminal domain-containing pilus assembly protein n=1 Tax=Aeromonas media TaxID=651 RepID=UPI0029552ABF|nr:PilX N-terminal domain-containing pilus assembly protein [Aeromonas media]WOQ13909.1 hypothetical protein R2X36_03150 [Aeromonas media]
MRHQSGFTTLSVTLILMLILLALSLLVGKVLVSDRRISLNEVQYRQAVAMAEQGLSDGFGRVASVDWRGTISGALESWSYTVQAQNASAVVIGGTTVVPVTIRSVATLRDEVAQPVAEAVAEAKYVSKPLVTDIPGSPLTVGGGMNDFGGSGEIVTNPNGGGPGVPVSIWSDKAVGADNASWKTCQPGVNGCGDTISDPKTINPSDIKASDINFPTDLVQYLFGLDDDPENEWWYALGAKKVPCNKLASTTAKIILVEGDCDATGKIGSNTIPVSPVILIIKDGNFTMNGTEDKNQINGLVFAYSSTDPKTSHTIRLNGGAAINGILVTNYKLDKFNGDYSVRYDASILDALKHGVEFKTLKLIPGSWHDW